jgi:hypothetical protein
MKSGQVESSFIFCAGVDSPYLGIPPDQCLSDPVLAKHARVPILAEYQRAVQWAMVLVW